MGGTVANGVGASIPTPQVAVALPPPPPVVTPIVGGGSWSTPSVGDPFAASVIGAAPQAYAAPQVQVAAALAQPQVVAQPAVAGGGAAPIIDAQAAIPILQQLVGTLNALVGALSGTAAVQGGGPGSTPEQAGGCPCHGGSPVQQSPTQVGDPGQAAPAERPPVDPAPAPAPAPTPSPSAPTQDAPPSGDVRQRIVQAARDELAKGVREDAGDNTDSGGRIREYRTAVTSPGENPDAAEPWCADFASWVWKQAGTPFGPGGEGEDWTVGIIDKAKQMGTWHDRGSYDPKPGDMVLIDWDGGSDVDHVAIVEKVEDGKVHTIGGNEADSIQNASYDLGDARMMGFVNPSGT